MGLIDIKYSVSIRLILCNMEEIKVEKIILGLLMMRGMTIYEIKGVINTKLESMCSSSSGSIHSAIRKLMEKEAIACQEEGNLKVYFITKVGREIFEQWIHEPMIVDKKRDIELSKLFFIGLANPSRREDLMKSYIINLKKQLEKLEQLQSANIVGDKELEEETNTLFNGRNRNEQGICKVFYERSKEDISKDIYNYQMITLQHGIDLAKFEIEWYQKLLGGINHE